MAKWADFLISSIRFTEAGGHKHVSHVLLHIDDEDSIGDHAVKTKDEVLRLLDNRKTIKTMRWDYSSPGWREGARVEPYTRGNSRYLRTVPDTSEEDNLDNMITTA